MELKISFQKNEANTRLSVSDNTDWQASGVSRTSRRLFLFLTNGKNKVTSVPNANTENVSVWEVENPDDGVFKALFLAVLPYSILNPYLKNSLVEFNEKLYIATKDLSEGKAVEDSTCWKEVTDPSVIYALTSFPNFSYTIGYFFSDDKVNTCIGQKAIAYAKEDCGCSDRCSMIEDFAWTQIYHTAAVYAFGFGDYKDAGKFLAMANSRCADQGTSSPCNCN